MLFSYGNLITLVVVLLILVIYRALDRNNRSLEKLKRFSDKISENMAAQVEEKTRQFRDLSLELQGSLRTGGEILSRARGVEELLDGRSADIAEIQKRFAEYDRALADLTAMSGRVEKNMQRLRDESSFLTDVDRRIEAAGARLATIERQVPALEQDIGERGRAAIASLQQEMVGALDGKVASISKALAASEAQVKDFSAYMARLESRQEQATKERLAEHAKALDAFDTELRGRLSSAVKRSEGLEDEVFSRLSSRIQEDEAAIARSIEAVEARLSDYQGDVDYRVKTLEETSHDVDALKASLSDTVQRMGAEIRSEMKALGADLTAGWTAEIGSAAAARDQIRAGMAEVESTLSGLKNKAYQDVEAKLSVFEDEFFADLRARSTAMQEKFTAWQSEMDRRAGEFEAEIAGRVGASEESVAALRETLRADSEKARHEAAAGFEKELAALRDSLETGSRRMHREIETGLAGLSAGLDAGRKELAELFETAKGEVATWEGRARQKLAETELSVADRIAGLSADASSAIGALRESFATQKDELITGTNEERMALRKELGAMSDALAGYRAELSEATEAAMVAMRTQRDAFEAETQKRATETQLEVEARLKEQRQLVNEAREKAEAQHEKLFGKIEESYRALSGNVAEIDKKVKGFQSQTRLFERADSLRAALEGTIEDMRKEMTRLNAERAEIAEIESQLAKTRKVADEVSGKLARFLAEKRRIEDMDGEFKKIMTLSRDVDLKLDTLSASNDALQQIQAKIRQFEEMGKAVEGGYERLEKKKEIITVTAEGVDRGFQRLEGLEKALQDADRSADDLAAKVSAMKADYETLAGNKKDADAAMDIVGRLGGIINELEERLEKAQGAREWMARTETRFEEIGRQAQDQVRLLESIIKAETRKEKPERGAPPMDKRDTVVKLSHQGWSVQEISRVTQLSRGEVELILELAPKV